MAQVKGNCSLGICPLQQAQTVIVLSKTLRNQLADACAEQSRSDFTVYRIHLQNAEECHRLHYLQMACERIAKAYRLRDTQTLMEADLYSHVVFSRFIQSFLRTQQLKERYRSQDAKRRHIERYARGLAEGIEKFAPAVGREQTPANAEYPWINGRVVSVPTHYHYPVTAELAALAGQNFLGLIETVIEDYDKITLSG